MSNTSPFDGLQRWSWHQSHDQATVLLLVPGDLAEDDLSVYLDEKHLIVSVRGDAPAIKGRLYASVKTHTSTWQLERDYEHKKTRKARTASTSDASSSSSSYAFLTDPDISSSFANSVAAQTDTEDFYMTDTDHETSSQPSRSLAPPATHRSPSFSPPSDSHDEETSSETHASEHERASRSRNREKFAPSVAASSRPVSPPEHSSLASSAISSKPIQQLSRLLTIHLDKLRPEIWPALIASQQATGSSSSLPIAMRFPNNPNPYLQKPFAEIDPSMPLTNTPPAAQTSFLSSALAGLLGNKNRKPKDVSEASGSLLQYARDPKARSTPTLSPSTKVFADIPGRRSNVSGIRGRFGHGILEADELDPSMPRASYDNPAVAKLDGLMAQHIQAERACSRRLLEELLRSDRE